MAEKMIGVKNFARNTDPGDNIYTWDTKIADKIEDFQEFSGFFDFFRQTFQVCEADLGYHRAISQGERHKTAEQSDPQRTEDWMRRRRRGHTRPPILGLGPVLAHITRTRQIFAPVLPSVKSRVDLVPQKFGFAELPAVDLRCRFDGRTDSQTSNSSKDEHTQFQRLP